MLKRKLSNEIGITRYGQHFADTEKSCSLHLLAFALRRFLFLSVLIFNYV